MLSNKKSAKHSYNVYVDEACANIDYKYGPYSSVEEAFNTLEEQEVLAVGLTVGIMEGGSVKEYWFQSACEMVTDLVPKGGGGDITNLTDEQKAALSSGITQDKVAKYDGMESSVTTAQSAATNAQNKANEAAASAKAVEDALKNLPEGSLMDVMTRVPIAYTKDASANTFIKEFFLDKYIEEELLLVTTISSSGARQVQIKNVLDNVIYANAWFAKDDESCRGLIRIEESNASGVSGYIIVDWDKRSMYDTTFYQAIINKHIATNIAWSPFVKTIIGDDFAKTIPVGWTDDYLANSVIKELYVENMRDEVLDVVTTSYNGTHQVVIKNHDSDVTYANAWYGAGDESYRDVIKIDEWQGGGMSGYIVVDWEKREALGMTHCAATIDKATVQNLSLSPAIKMKIDGNGGVRKFKRMLAIGDSITAAGIWQRKVGEILGCDVRTHAKGGIGIVTMVDGDGSGQPPTGYDPDTFGTANLYALTDEDVKDVDVIVLMGFYNARSLTLGSATDMYPSQNTFVGQVNYAVKRVYDCLAQAGNNNCKVVICSAHKFGKYAWSDKTAYDDGENIRLGAEMAAKQNALLFVDLMNHGNINKYNWNAFQYSATPYNANYIPASGSNTGVNIPFASLSAAPSASANNGKYITVQGESGCYKSNGTTWVKDATIPAIWNADQLHLNELGYKRIGEYIAGEIEKI